MIIKSPGATVSAATTAHSTGYVVAAIVFYFLMQEIRRKPTYMYFTIKKIIR